MTLDARARRAAHDFRRAVEDLDRAAPERSSFERFDLSRRRRQRNARVGVTLLASVIAIIAIIFATRAFPRAEQPAVPPTTNGRIVFVRYDHHSGEPEAFSMDPDGIQRNTDALLAVLLRTRRVAPLVARRDAGHGLLLRQRHVPADRRPRCRQLAPGRAGSSGLEQVLRLRVVPGRATSRLRSLRRERPAQDRPLDDPR